MNISPLHNFRCDCMSFVHLSRTRRCICFDCVGPQDAGAPVSSSLSESLIRGCQFGRCSFSLLFTREATHVGIALASAVVMLIDGHRRVLRIVLVPLMTTCTIVRVYMPPEAESHELFLHLGITTCGRLVVARVQGAENVHHWT